MDRTVTQGAYNPDGGTLIVAALVMLDDMVSFEDLGRGICLLQYGLSSDMEE